MQKAAAQTPVAQFSFAENTGVLTTQEAISATSFSIENHFQKPERISAPHGKALRLDGYSTWAFHDNFSVSNIAGKMAIEIWYATEAFNEKPAGLISQITGNAGFAIKINPFGKLIYQYFADDQSYFFTTAQSLPKYRWNHIMLQIDLENKKTQLYVNAELWAEQTLDEHDNLSFANTVTYLGRSAESPENAGFLLSAANGALDEINIFNQTFFPAEIAARYDETGLVETDLFIDPNIRHAGDHLRPRYHAMPNTSWTNESYGLTYFDGKYHLFFQKNPNSPSLYFMHWGHLSSPDLVSWKEERMALAPEPGFADFGAWSGTTALDENGVPVICYTGVDGQKAGIGMAFPVDSQLITWNASTENPVIPNPPPGYAHKDFRDPYIWKTGGFYYMIVGSGLQNNGGGILFSYKSSDLLTWQNIAPIYQNPNVAIGGTFWEMPSFQRFENGDYALIVTPQFNGKPAETIYWVGSFENEKFTPYHDTPKVFEHLSRNLLSPAFGNDEAGRITYLGIVPEDRNAGDQIASGWRHTFSLPRVARLLNDGNIGHYPHPNLCRLRQENIHIENRVITSGSNFNLPEILGDQYEMEMLLVPEPGARFSLQIFKNAAATMFTSIYGDLTINRLGVNRTLSSPYATTEDNRFSTYAFGDTVRLRVFVDHSVLEVFVDNLTVISTRVYPGEDQKLIDFIVPEGSVKIERLDFWEMGDKEELFPVEICEPDYLPGNFLSGIFDKKPPENEVLLFPNPVDDTLNVERFQKGINAPLEVKIYDANGRQVFHKTGVNSPSGLDVSALPSGLYFIEWSDHEAAFSAKFYKN